MNHQLTSKIELKITLIIVITIVSSLVLKSQKHGLHAFIPEELGTLIKNDQLDSMYVYFTGTPRKFNMIKNKLIKIFVIDRNEREIREFIMDYDSYYGYWTLYRFNEDWKIVEDRNYKEDTVVYACKKYLYNEDGEIIEESWTNIFNEEEKYSPYLNRKILFEEDQVIYETTSWVRNNIPKKRIRIVTDIYNRRGRLIKRCSVGDNRKIVTFYDRNGEKKRSRTYELDTLTNTFSLKIKKSYTYEYDDSGSRVFEEIRIEEESILQIHRRKYLNDILVYREILENGKIILRQFRRYDGNLLIEVKSRRKGDISSVKEYIYY
jgi:hypothetical protein